MNMTCPKCGAKLNAHFLTNKDDYEVEKQIAFLHMYGTCPNCGDFYTWTVAIYASGSILESELKEFKFC